MPIFGCKPVRSLELKMHNFSMQLACKELNSKSSGIADILITWLFFYFLEQTHTHKIIIKAHYRTGRYAKHHKSNNL